MSFTAVTEAENLTIVAMVFIAVTPILLLNCSGEVAADVQPSIVGNRSLIIEQYFPGKSDFHPISMTFIGPDDILLTEKDTGQVLRMINGTLLTEPLVDVPVANKKESGMLGIASKKTEDGKTLVFVYYTLSGGGEDGDDKSKNVTSKGSILERYELSNNKLIKPQVLFYINSNSLPPLNNSGQHVGGKVAVGPDGNIYLQVGDGMNQKTLAQNYHNGTLPNGTGGILRITEDGLPVDQPIYAVPSMKYYYSHGMRNGFGMDFDPLTGRLWDTEAGSTFGDEINLVSPGFNSGWSRILGPNSYSTAEAPGPTNHIEISNEDPINLVHSNGARTYSDPELAWNCTITPTSIKFLDSSKLGSEYENDLFVGEYNCPACQSNPDQNKIYHFELNGARDSILLKDVLEDGFVKYPHELKDFVFATGFEIITDLQVGPDGYLYILTFAWKEESGKIFRIVPVNENQAPYKNQMPLPVIAGSPGLESAPLNPNDLSWADKYIEIGKCG